MTVIHSRNASCDEIVRFDEILSKWMTRIWQFWYILVKFLKAKSAWWNWRFLGKMMSIHSSYLVNRLNEISSNLSTFWGPSKQVTSIHSYNFVSSHLSFHSIRSLRHILQLCGALQILTYVFTRIILSKGSTKFRQISHFCQIRRFRHIRQLCEVFLSCVFTPCLILLTGLLNFSLICRLMVEIWVIWRLISLVFSQCELVSIFCFVSRSSSTNTTNPFGSTFCYNLQHMIFEVCSY